MFLNFLESSQVCLTFSYFSNMNSDTLYKVVSCESCSKGEMAIIEYGVGWSIGELYVQQLNLVWYSHLVDRINLDLKHSMVLEEYNFSQSDSNLRFFLKSYSSDF